jgi:hypothetical protein
MATTTGQPAGSKKSASKKGAAKRAAKKPGGNGADTCDDFTAGDVNTNIRPDPAAAPRRGRAQADLPGMEDRKIPDLHAAALDYVGIRDTRMSLTEQETTAKDKVIALMKKHKKDEYSCEGVKIIFEHVEEDKLKVKVRKEEDDGAD